jgi:acyl carrier protein
MQEKTPRFSQGDKTTGANAAGRLARVFAEILSLPLDRVHPDLKPGDVKRWDSVGHVTLVVAIEEEFAIQLEAEEIMEFTSFQAIASAIERRLAAARREARAAGRTGT